MATFSTLLRPPKAQEQLSFATPYPVFFSRDTKDKPQAAGSVGVNASTTFRRLQADLSAKLGLEAHQAGQLQIVIVCSRASGNGEQVQQIPIHENTNFCVILNQHNPSRDKVVHFLVSIRDGAIDTSGRNRGAEQASATAPAGPHHSSESATAATDANLDAAKTQLLQQLARAANMSNMNGVGARPVGQWGALPHSNNPAAGFNNNLSWAHNRGMGGQLHQWQIAALHGHHNAAGKGGHQPASSYHSQSSFTAPLRQQMQQQSFPGALVHRMHPAKPDKPAPFMPFAAVSHTHHPAIHNPNAPTSAAADAQSSLAAAIQAVKVTAQAGRQTPAFSAASGPNAAIKPAPPTTAPPACATAVATAITTAALPADQLQAGRLFRAACWLDVKQVRVRLSEFWAVSLNDPVLHKPKTLARSPSPFGPIGKAASDAQLGDAAAELAAQS